MTGEAGVHAVRDDPQCSLRIYRLEFPEQSDDRIIEIRNVNLGLLGIRTNPLSVSRENRVVSVRLDRKGSCDIVERRGLDRSDAEKRAISSQRFDDVFEASPECGIIRRLVASIVAVIHA